MATKWMKAIAAVVVLSFGVAVCASSAAAQTKTKKAEDTKTGSTAQTKPRKVEDTKTGSELRKLESGEKPAGSVFDGRKHTDPVKVDKSTSTRTQEQAIKEYKESGAANPGPKTLKTKEPPAPRR